MTKQITTKELRSYWMSSDGPISRASTRAELNDRCLRAADLIDSQAAKNNSQAAEITRLQKLIDSKDLITVCPHCDATYIDHDGFGFCGCKEHERQTELQDAKLSRLREVVKRILGYSHHDYYCDMAESPPVSEICGCGYLAAFTAAQSAAQQTGGSDG